MAIPKIKKLKAFLETIFEYEKTSFIDLRIILCTDAFVLELNNKFLSHNYYTDVLTFNLGSAKEIKAEVYISLERVLENATSYGTSKFTELYRVMFHSILHLCGYEDKSLKAKVLMTAKEDKYLELYARFT